MSHKKLEQVLDLLINEDQEQAEKLLHDFVVEKARDIYESLVNDEFADDEMEDEFVGGDETEDFVDAVSSDVDDIEGDELNDGEVDIEDSESDESISDQIGELSDQLAELRDMFNKLVDAEMDEPHHSDDDFDYVGDSEESDEMEFDTEDGELESDEESDEDEMKEGVYEATKLHSDVPKVSNEEGKLAGTGKGSKTGATGKEAPYTKAPTKRLDGADPVDFTGEEKAKNTAMKPKKDPVSNNIDVKKGNVAGTGQETEGKLAGTGKGSKAGAVGKQSPLSKAPKI